MAQPNPFPGFSQDLHLDSSSENKGIESRVEESRTGNTSSQLVSKAMKPRVWLVRGWRWIATLKGCCITIYGLNVVAWGGMLFLLMCNAAPAMCHPTCNDLYSPRRIWIEITSQILNGLFCLPGLGLSPWRCRDLYWWFCWRLGNHQKSLSGVTRLAGAYQAWYRLPIATASGCVGDIYASQQAKSATTQTLDRPLICTRAPPTSSWKLDLVVWCNIWNIIFQGCLAGCMWGMNRFNRPSWTTGLFVALACGVAGIVGWMEFNETRSVARYEGESISAEVKKEVSVV